MTEKTTTKKVAKKAAKKATKTASKQASSTVTKKASTKKTTAKKTSASATDTFAVIATGGKQYVVHEGDTITIEKLADEHKEGDKVEFSDVLLVDDGKSTKVGEPTVTGAKVVAECIEEGRGKKIEVIRFRSKSRYFKNKGHRQPYSKVKVTKISA